MPPRISLKLETIDKKILEHTIAPMKIFKLLFFILCFPTGLTASWFGLWETSHKQYECSHGCGTFGSESIQRVEEPLLIALYCWVIGWDYDHPPTKTIDEQIDFYSYPSICWKFTPENGGCIFERSLKGDENDYQKSNIRISIPWSMYGSSKHPYSDCLYSVLEGGKVYLRKDIPSQVTSTQGRFKVDNFSSLIDLTTLIDADCLAGYSLDEFFLSEKTILTQLDIKQTKQKIESIKREIERRGTAILRDWSNNRIDLNEEIKQKERYVEYLETKLEKKLEEEFKEPIKKRIRKDERRKSRFLPLLEEAKTNYLNIHKVCAEKHQAPSAFYNLALMHFYDGDHMRALEEIDKVFERIDLDILEDHQASQICLSKGTAENQIALYDAAILSLGQAIKRNPENREAYFERALAYFEQGNIDQSIADFFDSGYESTPIDPKDQYSLAFATGLIKGTAEHAGEALKDFLPSIYTTLSGLSHGLWAFACEPIDVSKQLVSACQNMAVFLKDHESLEVVKMIVPEIKELSENWDNLEAEVRGELMGTIIGKHGTEFLIFYGVGKGIKAFQELRHANAALTLEKMAKDAAKWSKLEEMHQSWWKATKPIIEDIKKMKGDKFHKELPKMFNGQQLSELQMRQILHQCNIKTFPKPKGIPADCIVEISEKSGGMIYRKIGTSIDECVLVRVMPGNPKSSNVIQQNPYVVQRRGRDAVLKDGTLVGRKDPNAHIPLQNFEFTEL